MNTQHPQTKKDMKGYDKIIMSRDAIIQNFAIDDGKYLYWTDNKHKELPVIMKHDDNIAPQTIPQMFQEISKKNPGLCALRVSRKLNKDDLKYYNLEWSWEQYFNDCMKFAQSLIKIGIQERKSVNIIGFNAPEWAIAFFGSIFANNLPCGVYTTNNVDACCYQAQHSEAQAIVVQNEEQLWKYLQILNKISDIKIIIVYNDDVEKLKEKYKQYENLIIDWDDFLKLGDQEQLKKEVKLRMSRQKPGQCCNLIYTSGTTGNPKGVMLSHDNMIYNMKIGLELSKKNTPWEEGNERMVSFLPLSHSAAQCADLLMPMLGQVIVTFARPDAFQGSLLETLRQVRPTIFFAVPRVWEKFEEQLKQAIDKSSNFKKSLLNWARDKGYKANIARFTISEEGKQKKSAPLGYPIAQKLVLNRIKSTIGLDQTKVYIYGAAPLSRNTQEFFFSLDIFPIGLYGMTETSGTVTAWSEENSKMFTVGFPMQGVDIKIHNPDENGQGEILMRGRPIFMGYYKDVKATQETFDKDGYIHSGDLGILKDGFLEITGRIKELIITAGGENIAPILIEQVFKEECDICSNILVIGDQRKFLSCLITLKVNMDSKNFPTQELTDQCKQFIKQHIPNGDNINTVQEAIKSQGIQKYIGQCIENANKRAISRAQHIRKWIIIPNDFSVIGEELTPSLKIRRKIIEQKYQNDIEKLYSDPKL